MAFHFNGVLIPDKQEILAEPQNEIADIVHNLILQYTLVDVFDITRIQFFRVDKIQ